MGRVARVNVGSWPLEGWFRSLTRRDQVSETMNRAEQVARMAVAMGMSQKAARVWLIAIRKYLWAVSKNPF